MRQRAGGMDQILKLCMTGICLILAALLLGKAVMQADWGTAKYFFSRTLEKQAARGLEVLWRQFYPGISGAGISGQEGRAGGGEICLEFLFRRFPVYRYGAQKEDSRPAYSERDPSYLQYLSNQEFYKEHEYLFRYGDEVTNETAGSLALADSQDTGELPASGDGSVSVQGALGSSRTPAYTVSDKLPITGTGYVREQLADYDYLMKHFYSVHASTTAGRDLMDAEKLLDKDMTLQKNGENPQILIYHTHSQETFADYGPQNQGATVVSMGTYLTKLLTEKGYQVIHDASVYDLKDGKLDRNKAYTYALEGVTGILQKYPSIQVVLDLHRDGVSESLHMVSEINGKPTAPIMFFNGVSQTPDGPIEYLPNPYREDNLAFSLKLQMDAAAYYPGLTRKIYIKGLRYNLHLRPRSALIEVGAQTNTYEEAKNAMEPLAELLDMVLQGK